MILRTSQNATILMFQCACMLRGVVVNFFIIRIASSFELLTLALARMGYLLICC
jgi:hypothetical protein